MQESTSRALKDKHRTVRDSQDENLRVRIHRALSWLERSEREPHDPDAQFLFLWISFNAAYASEFGFEQGERDKARMFVRKLVKADGAARIHDALLHQFTGPVRTLIDNKFVFEPFWKALREHDSSDRWSEQFADSRRLALRAIMEGDTETVLSIVLDRLYTLRNQLVHGGATWNGSANRTQVQDGARILLTLVPIVIDVLMDGETEFGGIAYPYGAA